MTQLLQSLIYLKSFFMEDIWFTATSSADSFDIMVPHLQLSLLQLTNINATSDEMWMVLYKKNIELKETTNIKKEIFMKHENNA
ncbi:unnamed protein product [Cunninghamella blakesleeana]